MNDKLITYGIYHLSREYAHEIGDPLLGTVQAASKEEAEKIAPKQLKLPWNCQGVWAWPIKEN